MNKPIQTFLKSRVVWLFAAAGWLGTALSGCTREDYYCDNSGCYFCDGAGCRTATPPSRNQCTGDFDCPTGQTCTTAGCVTGCRADRDCNPGWVCRGATATAAGVCVAPSEPTPTPVTGNCRTNADCENGTICINGTCRQTTIPACQTNQDCSNGQLCVSGRCTTPANTCQFNNECGPGRMCINNECRDSCAGSVVCPTGQDCIQTAAGAYCRDHTSGCVSDFQCATGERCISGTCYQTCTVGSGIPNTCGTGKYCSDDGVCVTDTRPRPFCDAEHPCQAGSDCVGGVCRIPCTTVQLCQMIDTTNFRACGPLPSGISARNYCLTANESNPQCHSQTDCTQGQNCIDSACR